MNKIFKDSFIEALKSKDIDAFNYIIDNYSNLIFKVAYGLLNNRELSEECINDVYMKVWNNAEKINISEDKFKNWLCTVTKYTAIDMLRKEKKHGKNLSIEKEIIASNNSIEKNFEDIADLRIIKEEINSMDKIDKDIFISRFYYGESIKNISAKLSLSENAVNLRILRGRKKLSEKLKEDMK